MPDHRALAEQRVLRMTIENIKHHTETGPLRLDNKIVEADRYFSAAVAVLEGGGQGVSVSREADSMVIARIA